VLLEQVAEALADGDALFERAQGPVFEGVARGLHGAGDVVGVDSLLVQVWRPVDGSIVASSAPLPASHSPLM
jgi:hypothetical protein